MSSAAFLGDDGEALCRRSLTEIKQKGGNGKSGQHFDGVCVCLLLHLSQTSNLCLCGSFC